MIRSMLTRNLTSTKGLATRVGLLAASILAATGGAANAQWRMLYQNDFEAREFSYEWSSNTRLESWYPSFTTFNGNYSSEFTQLTLRAVPRDGGRNGQTGDGSGGGSGDGGMYRIKFDLYIIDSWDGSERTYGVDRLQVLANTRSIFDNTFSNHNRANQSFSAPQTGGRNLGFHDGWNDAIYRNITLEIPTSAVGDRLVVRWQDTGLQGVNDESWGIDNVEVSYNPVPTPGTGAAALAAAGLLSRRRRR